MKIILIMSILFCANPHPIALISILISILIISSMFMTIFLKNSWISLILILIMLGGLLILFIYIASLASNENFTHKKMIFLTPFIVFIPAPPLVLYSELNEAQMLTLFSSNTSFNNCIAILYLLISLFVVIENISCYKAPLRSKL